MLKKAANLVITMGTDGDPDFLGIQTLLRELDSSTKISSTLVDASRMDLVDRTTSATTSATFFGSQLTSTLDKIFRDKKATSMVTKRHFMFYDMTTINPTINENV